VTDAVEEAEDCAAQDAALPCCPQCGSPLHAPSRTDSVAAAVAGQVSFESNLLQLRGMEGCVSDALGGTAYTARLVASDARARAAAGAPPPAAAATYQLEWVVTASPDDDVRSRAEFWAALWASARPCPAAAQRPLHSPAAAGEMALSFLESMTPTELTAQLLGAGLGVAAGALTAAATLGEDPLELAAAAEWSSRAAPACARLHVHCLAVGAAHASASGSSSSGAADGGGPAAGPLSPPARGASRLGGGTPGGGGAGGAAAAAAAREGALRGVLADVGAECVTSAADIHT
jgi:hypothetical protein